MSPRREGVNEEAAANLWVEPCRLWRHDETCLGNIEQFIDRCRVHRKGDIAASAQDGSGQIFARATSKE